jgi:hypothetical protein
MKKINGFIRTVSFLCLIMVSYVTLYSQNIGGYRIHLTSSGWTLAASPDSGYLNISHDSLGVVLKKIRINTKVNQQINPITNWTAEVRGNNKLVIKTENPASSWILELNLNNIIISATSTDMILTAEVPATSKRIVAKLMEEKGVPVEWTGTDEVVGSFNGKETKNQSFLPQKNTEVMTFALGQVSATNLNSLFDREADIAIQFPESSIMKRNPENDDFLDLIIPIPGEAILRIIPEYYTKTLGLPFYSAFNDKLFPTAPVIWGSWTAYYQHTKESDIVKITDWLATNLKPYGFQVVQIDDGYDRGQEEGHYWIENWDKNLFPHGPEWIAHYIKSKGFTPGLWLVPNSYAGSFAKHPEWYLHDKLGKLIKDYNTPALDCTNPAAQDWLKKLFGTLKGWGFEYFKFDGEFALPKYAPAVDITKLYNSSIDPLTAYRNRLSIIRNTLGPESFIEGCPAGTPLNGIGYFNSYFNGADMYNSWKGCHAVFSSINANAFLNHIAVYLMPGEGIDVAPEITAEEARRTRDPESINIAMEREDPFTGFGTSLAESRTLVSFVLLTGVAYPLTSVMTELPEERVKLLKMTMPTMPILPVDLYSRGAYTKWDQFKHTTAEDYIHNYPEILDLKVNASSGIYDVIGFTNWRSETMHKKISFRDKLGLSSGVPYVLFDFWNQKLLGVFHDSLEITIEPHDTRVLSIHAMQKNPQLIGNSRHISGAYSIKNLEWNEDEKTLSGTSETIPGADYSLFIYVPDGMTIKEAMATIDGNSAIDVKTELIGNSLRISFQGHQENILWEIEFLK